MTTATISMRQKFTIQMTNMFRDSCTPSWDHGTTTFRGTPRQVMVELREFERISGGCNTARRLVDSSGCELDGITVQDLADAIRDVEFEKSYRRESR